MNNPFRASRANVFLVELIIVILFFSIAAAVLLQIFQRADQLSDRASNLSYAVIAAQDAAESQRALSLDQVEPLSVYYDETWQPASESEASYTVNVTPVFEAHSGGTLVTFSVAAASREKGVSIYTLNAKKYYAGQYQEGGTNEE